MILGAISTNSYGGVSASHVYGQHCRLIFIVAQQIAGGRDEGMRYDIATDLALYVKENPKCGDDDAVVSEIEAMLDDHNDGVEARAAQALGYIGPPAIAAVPALKRALVRYKSKVRMIDSVMLPSRSPVDSFEDAIEKITGIPYRKWNEGN